MLRHVRSRLGSTLSTEPITDVDRLSIGDIRESLGFEPTGDPETDRQLVEEVLADPDLALQLLEQLPVVCSVVLEGLIEMRGHAGPDEIRALIRERTTLDADEHLENVAALLTMHGLATVSTLARLDWDPVWLFVTTAAEQCCPALLKGLTLPRAPSTPPTPESWVDPDPGALLRFVELLDRRVLRLTESTSFHKGDLRSYTRALACDQNDVFEWLMDTADLGLVGVDDRNRLWPRARGIRAALSGDLTQPPLGGVERMVWDILPEEGWVPMDAIARACVRIAGLRDFTTVANGVRKMLRPTVWVERGFDVSGLWLRRRDRATTAQIFAEAAPWKRLARCPVRPARLEPLLPTDEDVEVELAPYVTGRIGKHEFEKMLMEDVPEDEQDLWVPLTCDAPESLRARYEQAMAHGFAGDRHVLPGYAQFVFSDPGWRPRLFSQAELHAAIEDAAAAKRPVEIHVERDNQYTVHWVRPIRVNTQGPERSVLAVEVDTDVGMAFPLSAVVEVDTVRRFTG